MASSKTGRKANAAAKKGKQSNAPVEKDDGTRWIVVDVEEGYQVYPGVGVMKGQATRLAEGLVRPAKIVQVEPLS